MEYLVDLYLSEPITFMIWLIVILITLLVISSLLAIVISGSVLKNDGSLSDEELPSPEDTRKFRKAMWRGKGIAVALIIFCILVTLDMVYDSDNDQHVSYNIYSLLIVCTTLSVLSIIVFFRKNIYSFLFISAVLINPIIIHHYELNIYKLYFKYILIASVVIIVPIMSFDIRSGRLPLHSKFSDVFDRYDLIFTAVLTSMIIPLLM